MRVPYIDLGAQYKRLKPEIDSAMQRVMYSGGFILRGEVQRFEERMAEYLGVKHVIGVGNGYDALFLALKVYGVGKGTRVRADTYTHVSTHAAVVNAGAELVFHGPADMQILVHMNGRVDSYVDTADYMPTIEDACQALGARFCGRRAGSFGEMGCFSLHPMKVLSCAGDGGFISTNSDQYSDRLRDLRHHGNGKGYGYNSRLDTLQAAILNVKFDHLERFIEQRRAIAKRYDEELNWVGRPHPPIDGGANFDVYSSYVLHADQSLLKHLTDNNIEAFSHIRTDCVSLPIYPEMPAEHVDRVIEVVNAYPGHRQ